MSAKALYQEIELSTDSVMEKLWITLFEDFQSTFGLDFVPRAASLLRKGDMRGFRDYIWPTRRDDMSVFFYKWMYQLENLFKRYRHKRDPLTDADLHEATLKKFRDTQVRCARPLKITSLNYRVLQRARKIVTKILGIYDLDKHYALCRHGKRACQGTPYRASYLDVKLTTQPFTCSSQHLSFFEGYCEGDSIMRSYLDAALKDQRVCLTESLEYTEVPKSWKIHRSMMPNTLLGAFYTAGLGEYIRLCLLDAGMDIRELQETHKELARLASMHGKWVTADLQAASDSLSLQLLRILLPIKWYRALTRGRARYVSINGDKVYLSSVLTMGLGSTFPLQTLIFYSLIKAIGELDGREHMVSVFGDDLIYSGHLHKYVRRVFPHLHLIVNEDKTYAKGHFRESCGGDFYRGADVRPYQPEGGSQFLVGPRKQEFLYRLYNGLCRRWDEVEIPKTLQFLRMEVLMHGTHLLQVPPSFPDGSGIRVSKPVRDFWYAPVLWKTADRRDDKLGVCTEGFTFSYLHAFNDSRVVQTVQLPYYWEKLRTMQERDVENSSRACDLKKHRNSLAALLHKFGLPTGDYYAEWDLDPSDVPAIQWAKAQKNPRYIRSKITGHRFRRLVAQVSKKGSTTYRYTEARLSSWH